MEQTFLADGGSFEEKFVGEIFKIETPKRRFDANKIQFGGQYPYVARGESNNGIRGYITEDKQYLNNGNTISFGQDTATMFYQREPYFTGDKIKVFSLRSGSLNRERAQYLITALRIAFSLFSWGASMFNVKNLQSTVINIPYKNGKIAFDYMERIVRQLRAERAKELRAERAKELRAFLELSNLTDVNLSKDEENALNLLSGSLKWKEFKIIEIFTVKNTHNIMKSQITLGSGNVPYVTASASNNSIAGYIDFDKSQIEQGQSIMIGGKTLVITYQRDDYFSNDSHNLALYIKYEHGKSENKQLFLVSALFKSLNPLYEWSSSIAGKKIQSNTVLLPVLDNGEIAFNIMEAAIQAVKKLVIADVVQFNERELAAYESLA